MKEPRHNNILRMLTALRWAERPPPTVATVALADKTARTIRALLAHNRAYRANFVSRRA